MAELVSYFDIGPRDQRDLLTSAASHLGRGAALLEKDIWVCKALDLLFNLPDTKSMVFKGGTSLSKGFSAIARFSEDVDVTIDYRQLVDDPPQLDTLITSRTRNEARNRLTAAVIAHLNDDLAPKLKSAVNGAGLPAVIKLGEANDEAENIWLAFESVIGSYPDYVRPDVLLEFGGRNAITPHKHVTIRTDVAKFVESEGVQISLPVAVVPVLSPQRTFWEKATLIHVECNRNVLRADARRLSRHWHDLAHLGLHTIGKAAIQDRSLLEDVISVKRAFFYSAYANYDDCLNGRLRLVPTNPEHLDQLRVDYEAMVAGNMIEGTPLSFGEIVERLTNLADQINHQS